MSLFDDDCGCHRKKKCNKKFDPDCRFMKRCMEKHESDCDCDDDCKCHRCNRCHKKGDSCCHKKCHCCCRHKKHRNKCDGCACEVLKKTGRGVIIEVVTDSGQTIIGKFLGFDKDNCCVTLLVIIGAMSEGTQAPAEGGDNIAFVDCRKIESVIFAS